jgi:hypothetical protein
MGVVEQLSRIIKLSQIMVRFKGILRSVNNLLFRVRGRAYINDVIGCQFEEVRNGHRFEN